MLVIYRVRGSNRVSRNSETEEEAPWEYHQTDIYAKKIAGDITYLDSVLVRNKFLHRSRTVKGRLNDHRERNRPCHMLAKRGERGRHYFGLFTYIIRVTQKAEIARKAKIGEPRPVPAVWYACGNLYKYEI